jgi:hypothetical protein
LRNVAAQVASFILLLGGISAQNLELPKLPYDYDALEPAIDEATMRVHHLGHHAGCTEQESNFPKF